MRNSIRYYLSLFFLLLNLDLVAQELEINSSKMQYDNINKITIFEGNVNSNDEKGNKLFSEYAEYNKIEEVIETKGDTKIITSSGYEVFSTDVIYDNQKNIIYSNNQTKIIDKDGNNISLEMFNYSTLKKIFFSKGDIKIKDINNNNYNFSEIYIDENKKKIVGSDIKAFLNQPEILINSDNNPRFFANTFHMSDKKNTFEKGIFTYCKNENDEKCPPWTLKSKKIQHDLAKKTIYYDNVVLKIYDFPIFFFPRFSHPDPTVNRRSGVLAPQLSNSSTLGSGVATPYFWNIATDKDLTFTPKFFVKENPLFLAEYRQDFINSFLIIDAGYTKGYKENNNKKSDGGRAHFFTNFNINLIDKKETKSSLEINVEKVSNDTYLKIYDVESFLVNKEKTVLENKIDFLYQDKNLFFGLTPSVYENTDKQGNKRHEYLLPLTIEKNIMASEKYGFLDLGSNLTLRNHDANKKTAFLINNFKWKTTEWLNSMGIESYFEGLVKNVNYKAKNTDEYKNDKDNSEIHSALGYFTKFSLFKKDLINKKFYTLTPKFLLRYAPDHARKTVGGKLNYGNLFNLNKLNKQDVLEPGLSTSVGFEYKKNKLDESNIVGSEQFSFSIGQVISAKENMDIPSSTSLDQRFSDVVGETRFRVNDQLNINYNFSLDQGYNDFNYNELEAKFSSEKVKFNLSYLEEKKHIGRQEFVQTGFDVMLTNSSEFSFNTKRNILSDSAEFYNLSYNYVNDCLKAGLVYRREFYTDRDVEPANTLMFTISIIPFAEINSPGLSR